MRTTKETALEMLKEVEAEIEEINLYKVLMMELNVMNNGDFETELCVNSTADQVRFDELNSLRKELLATLAR